MLLALESQRLHCGYGIGEVNDCCLLQINNYSVKSGNMLVLQNKCKLSEYQTIGPCPNVTSWATSYELATSRRELAICRRLS